MPPTTRSNTTGKTHEEGIEKGEGLSSPKPEEELLSMMSQLMAQMEARMAARMETRVKEFETRWTSNQNTLVGALKEVRASRSVTPKSDRLHLKASGIEHVVSRGNGGYEEYVGKECGMNGDDRGDYESRYHEDGLNRRGCGKRAPKSHGEWHSRREREIRFHEEPPRRSYGEYMGNEYGVNGEGGYWDYRCYEGKRRGRHERGDESRYHGDGLDRGGIRELVSRLQE